MAHYIVLNVSVMVTVVYSATRRTSQCYFERKLAEAWGQEKKKRASGRRLTVVWVLRRPIENRLGKVVMCHRISIYIYVAYNVFRP